MDLIILEVFSNLDDTMILRRLHVCAGFLSVCNYL